ncbi:MAG: FkbM family methyltransferase [Oscillospiraceae bacterium]|nr:FkbM family methyltransferase [Oscillospiraceae bacterium]
MLTFDEKLKRIEKRYKSGKDTENLALLKNRLTNRPVILYGLGFFGGVIVKNFAAHGIDVECFCDSNKTGTDAETGLQIISPDVLVSKFSGANVVVSAAAPRTHKAIYDYVLKLGFNENQVFTFDNAFKFFKKSRVEVVNLTLDEIAPHLNGYKRIYDFLKDETSKAVVIKTIESYLFNDTFEYEPPDNSYFPDEIKLTDNEVFVDAGLYFGDTTKEFIKRVNGKYKHIYGFDIDEQNLERAIENLGEYSNIEIIPKGLWSGTCEQKAELGLLAGSNVKESASSTVSLISLDELFSDKPAEVYPTFIKIDIEGSEKQALLGSEKTIKTARPIIAVCTYHKPEDIYELTDILYKFNPDYSFMLKHYSPYTWDTVLYAY